METNILTPRDLFQKDVRYMIPPFQRPYVWKKVAQWEPLWEDVQNVAETYLEELYRFQDSIKAQENTAPHFLGAIVLKQEQTPVKEIERREVIDGQQRVTTLQILLDAVQEVCEELKLVPEAKRLSKLVTNDKDLIGDNSHHLFKLWPAGSDQIAFRHAMTNGLAVDDFSESLIVQSHEFFKAQVEQWLGDEPESISRRAEALETTVTTMLNMVVIDLNHSDDPHVIFETLNARGTPLEQSDLIKNFVMSESSRSYGENPNVWKGLDDKWWREEVRQGRLYRPRIDMLINYWLAMRKESEVAPTNLFRDFRTYASDKQISYVMSELRLDLGNYRKFMTKTRVPREDIFYHRTDVMQAGVITPVLLILLNASLNSRLKAFAALESFLIRRMACRRTTKDYNRLTLELASELKMHDGSNVGDVVARFLRSQKADSRKWPNDEDVREAFRILPLYRVLTRGRLRLILEGIEGQLRLDSMADEKQVPRKLTIEHVMPQSWGQNWPLPECLDESGIESFTQKRNHTIHTVGNLTLVNHQLNAKLSNAAWVDKCKTLDCHSNLFLNKELKDSVEWNESEIKSRSERMAELFAEIWPGPESPVWEVEVNEVWD